MESTLRPGVPEDATFLADMLAEAMAWRPGSTRPPISAVLSSRYIAG
jgi:hypothetical protein